ncbi:MAG: hypothetical protein NVSMB46_04720 [Candidatus Saccharimonadales bacterium]
MLEKIKNYNYKTIIALIKDIRVLGLLAFTVIVILVSWSGVKVIQINFDLEKQVAKLKQENQIHELENNNMKLQNEYYKTNTYLELSARKQFGKALPGESVIIIPKQEALTYSASIVAITTNPYSTIKKTSTYKNNLNAWLDFFTHRNHSN